MEASRLSRRRDMSSTVRNQKMSQLSQLLGAALLLANISVETALNLVDKSSRS